jgi:hypothetical protein
MQPSRSSDIRFVVIWAAAMAATACSPTPTPEPIPTSIDVTLPSVKAAGGCRGVGTSGAILAGDEGDPRYTWLDTPGGRQEIVWPPGYSARFYRFDGPFDVLDATGRVVYREGDAISGGCVAGPNEDPASILRMDPAFQ